MTELGVTDEQFYAACEKASATGNPVHKKIVDQITAVDNFMAFKKLMCKRNTDLNVKAEASDPVLPAEGEEAKASDQNSKSTPDGQVEKARAEMRDVLRVAEQLERAEEEEMLKKAIAESEDQERRRKQMDDEEEEMIRKAIELSQMDSQFQEQPQFEPA